MDAPFKLPLTKWDSGGKDEFFLVASPNPDPETIASGLYGEHADYIIAAVNSHAELTEDLAYERTRGAEIDAKLIAIAKANADLRTQLSAAERKVGELRKALTASTEAIERMAKRLDGEPGNQTVVALWLHLAETNRAALRASEGKP